MKCKKDYLVVLIIIIIIGVVGCSIKQEDNNLSTENNIGLTDSIINEEREDNKGFTLEEIRELIEKSTTIEVKNIDNQVIGKISSREKVNKVIEDIFDHNAIDSDEYSSEGNVIGTINFYPSSNEPIYGLIKDKFIYIEGYYFTSKNNSIQKILDYVQLNTEEEPIVID